jgi:hypothetical protein
MYNVKVIEKDTREVIESLNNVTLEVAKAIAKGYAYDPFYVVKISN